MTGKIRSNRGQRKKKFFWLGEGKNRRQSCLSTKPDVDDANAAMQRTLINLTKRLGALRTEEQRRTT